MTAHTDKACVAALYRFVSLPDYAQLRAPLLATMHEHDVRGTLLLAEEGINGTIAGNEQHIDLLLNWLAEHPQFGDRLGALEVKKSWADAVPFLRSKVKLKREIVTLGVAGIDPTKTAGLYVKPQDWNDLISRPDVITIDTRNDYEVRIGSFKNALNPNTKSFRDFPQFLEQHLDNNKQQKVAMFCTGGIRCEKSTAYLKSLGYEEVYHLQGGILSYLEQIPAEQSLWQGECFVFDERVAVDHDLQAGSYTQCHACRAPLNSTDTHSALYVPGESCPHCHDRVSTGQRKRFHERQKQIDLAKQRGEQHLGDEMDALRRRRQAEKAAVKARQRKAL